MFESFFTWVGNCLDSLMATSLGKCFGRHSMCDIMLLQGFPHKMSTPKKTQESRLNLKSIIASSKVSLAASIPSSRQILVNVANNNGKLFPSLKTFNLNLTAMSKSLLVYIPF